MPSASPPEQPSVDADADRPLVLLGGSFDPVHHGHLRSAIEAGQRLGTTTVHLLPASVPGLRDPLSASAEQRLHMLQLAVDGDRSLAIDDEELRRGGATYTVDTLQDLRQRWPNRALVFLLGADAFSRLTQWQNWQQLLKLANLGVLTRPGQALSPPADASFRAHFVAQPETLIETSHGGWCSLPVTPLAISASNIRGMLQLGQSPRYLLPDAVLRYINEHGLYRHPARGEPG